MAWTPGVLHTLVTVCAPRTLVPTYESHIYSLPHLPISIYCIARRLQSSRHSFIGLRARAEEREISIRRRCRDKMNFVA